MQSASKFLQSLGLIAGSALLLPAIAPAQQYQQTNLVSNVPGKAPIQDDNLKNAWGITRSPDGGPWWVANNNSGTSTLYDGSGNIFPPPADGGPLVVVVPQSSKGSLKGTASTPTGIVFNGSASFELAPKTPAIFIFVTEDGVISGWNPGLNPDITHATKVVVDNSDGDTSKGAVYKGATSAEIGGSRFLYVTNFRSGEIEVYDSRFKRVHLSEEAFQDDNVAEGFAPFNIQNVGGVLFVTYARQDAAKHDPAHGAGGGFVEIFTPSGERIGSLEHGDWFNAPWGVVWTTRDFGEFSNAILVGNFRSGWIAAFNGFTHKFLGFVRNSDNSLMAIDGLWSLTFGNDGLAGQANTLYFSAGINKESDGLFGTITPVNGLDGDEE
jgi:uncharacterized protein (TIGR03118 family)